MFIKEMLNKIWLTLRSPTIWIKEVEARKDMKPPARAAPVILLLIEDAVVIIL